MYAVFKLSGFQYRAEEGTVLQVPKQKLEKGDQLDIPDVLLVQDGDKIQVGTPYVDGAKVLAEVLGHGQDDKVIIYKYKRRTKYRRTQGHRQDYTEVKISKITSA